MIFPGGKGKLLLPAAGQKSRTYADVGPSQCVLFNPGMIVFLVYSISSCVSMLFCVTG